MSDLPPLPPMPAADRERLTGLVLGALDGAFGHALAAVIVKGSALHGDFVPHYSDFDVHAFVTAGLSGPRTPDIDHALALQRLLAPIDATAFAVAYIQLYTVAAHGYPADWVPPVPGTYAIVRGQAPDALRAPDAATLRAAARAFFERVRLDADACLGRIADAPAAGLAQEVRRFATLLKPLAHHAAILRGADPLRAWTLPLGEILPPSPALLATFQEIRRWPEVRGDPKRLRALFRLAYTSVAEVCSLVAG